jgi:hypothetical protein
MATPLVIQSGSTASRRAPHTRISDNTRSLGLGMMSLALIGYGSLDLKRN